MQISIYTNFDRVCGQNHRRYQISLNVSLTGSSKRVVPTKNFEIKIFILKFAKKKKKHSFFYPKIKN